MRIAIRAKNLEITPALRAYIEAKIIAPVKRLLRGASFSELLLLDIEISRTTRHHRKGRVYYAEAMLTIGKTVLRAEVDDEDVRAACDLLQEELAQEIRRFKGRILVQTVDNINILAHQKLIEMVQNGNILFSLRKSFLDIITGDKTLVSSELNKFFSCPLI